MRKIINISLNLLFVGFIIISIVCFKMKFETSPETIPTIGEIDKLSGNAHSVVVMETSTHRVLYAKNPHDRRLTASISKILTVITALENMNLDRYVVVDETVLKAIGSSIYLKIGDIVNLRDLLYGALLHSGNDACLMVAKSYSGNMEDFIIRMNEIVKRLKMNDSSFENPTGLDNETKNYSSAYDMCLLTSYAMRNSTFRTIAGTKTYQFSTVEGKVFRFVHKHRLVREDDEVIAGKTGFTKLAGRTLVSVFERKGMEIIICTMDAGNDWDIHRNLANWAFEEYQMKMILNSFDFQMSTLHLDPKRLLLKPIYYPLRENEEVDTMIQISEKNAYLKVMQEGEVVGKIPLELTLKE